MVQEGGALVVWSAELWWEEGGSEKWAKGMTFTLAKGATVTMPKRTSGRRSCPIRSPCT